MTFLETCICSLSAPKSTSPVVWKEAQLLLMFLRSFFFFLNDIKARLFATISVAQEFPPPQVLQQSVLAFLRAELLRQTSYLELGEREKERGGRQLALRVLLAADRSCRSVINLWRGVG